MGKYKINKRTGKFDLVGNGSGDLPEGFYADYLDTKTTAYNSLEAQNGRRVNNLNQYGKVEMFRVYYARNGATGREVQFGLLFRREYDILAVANFTIMLGYAESKGGEYCDFHFESKYERDGFSVIDAIKICRCKIATGTGPNMGYYVVYMDVSSRWDSVSYYMGARYGDNLPSGGCNYDYINTRFVLPDLSVGIPITATIFDPNEGDITAENVSYSGVVAGNNVKQALDTVGANLGEIGVISQTQNWANKYKSYTLSNIVRGVIPKSFIDQWNAFCKVYSKDRQGKFNPQTGYFEANGLTDISYEEAMICLSDIVTYHEFTQSSKARTLFVTRQGRGNSNVYDLFREAQAETIYGFGMLKYGTSTTLYAILYEANKVRDVDFVIQCEGKFGDNFEYTYNLRTLKLRYLKSNISLKYSEDLSLESIVYMVQNSWRATHLTDTTTTLTIHLHEQAYNRAFDDETEYTWQGQTYYGIFELAEAVGISIVYP